MERVSKGHSLALMDSLVTIVVQGTIDSKKTNLCIHKLRILLPKAEVVLSIWKGNRLYSFNYDKLLMTDDPGCSTSDDIANTYNNINRQIVSTQAGLEKATRPYCLKIRTDILLENVDFLKEFGRYDEMAPPLHVKNRILICNYYTRNPRVYPLPFHPSDWVLFGRTEDLKRYFSAPCESTEEIRWFTTHPREQTGFYTNLLSRYVPEQYLCLNFLRQFEPVHCDCFYDATEENIRQTERMLAGDFVVLDYQKQFGIRFTKYRPNRYLEKSSLVSHRYWKQLFQEYCLHKTELRPFRLFLCFLARIGFALRRVLLHLLHCLHIKEKVKRLLSRK
ncbi:WavE lipopolysaccharide synthesis family protein [Agathobaculum sp. NTUH-O15-33]|uniref:WavE lipopolysaccharide synthesis family protein n=1 Tax=Agathobaculum sp. NTUH-O15-33 TaxID=3079302 RepID=UPI002958C141|nr:WavE lipopolysaccharide synthesis family protein [Agathobaculum sp. NTUH-O15-33]WNX85165.1 WavE lipopolysaccharide synthesis family protein [Agathobaculum sp. NTUH-O15-33]